MNVLRALASAILLALTILSTVCVYRAIFIFKKPIQPIECASDLSHVPINEQTRPGVIDRFSRAIQFRTITSGTRKYDALELERLIQFLYDSRYLKLSSTCSLCHNNVIN